MAVLELPITAAHAPHVHGTVTLIPIGAKGAAIADYRIGAVRIPVSFAGARLEVAVKSARPTYAPGEEAQIDLDTMPLHVRAGAIVPHGPVREYTEQQTSEPMTMVVYPGADGAFTLYEDDGRSFDYRQGRQMRLAMRWNDAARRLSIGLAPRSTMLPPSRNGVRCCACSPCQQHNVSRQIYRERSSTDSAPAT